MKNETDNDLIFYNEISELLAQARRTAYKNVNAIMVQTYWQIGRKIVEQEQKGLNRAEYGDQLVTNLSRHLSGTFGKGFSEANLRNMRQFYLIFPDHEEFSGLNTSSLQFATHRVANLSWSNIRQIMRLDDPKEREYYIREASSQNWSARVLERNIKTGYYRRLLTTQAKRNEELDFLAKQAQELDMGY